MKSTDIRQRRTEAFGRFDLDAGCFRLTGEPPRKWINLHCTDPGEHEVYAEISNIGDGPISVRDYDGNTCQLVGYDSRYTYVRDDETNAVFNPWGEPVARAVQNREARYYAAKTEVSSECEGLRISQRVFVPRKGTFEANTLTVENLTDRERKVSVFVYAMFQLTGKNAEGGGVWKDNSSQIVSESCGVLVTNRDRSVPTDRFKGALLTLNAEDYAGASGYRDHFTRSDFGYGTPRILWGWNCDNQPFFGPDCAGVVQVCLTLPAGATRRADFLLAQVSGIDEMAQLQREWDAAKLDEACAEQEKLEANRAQDFTVDTGNPNQDALINLFSKKQMAFYLVNKSGFRDNMQNDMGVALFDYPMARANILRAVASQYANGSVPHSFRPWNRLQYSDKPAWLLHCIPWVIKESGDMALLDERVGYCDSNATDTIWTHMLKAMRFLAGDTGVNGLCDQHFADWNDGLEPSEETGDRESVMVTQQLCLGLLEIEDLAIRRGETDVVEEARKLYADFSRRLNDVAWDGEWYVRTLCGKGWRIGSAENDEARIFVNTQSWAILSGIASEERARSCMDAVDRYIEKEYGFAITDPAFTRFDQRIGKFSASRPMQAENGGCYNHAAGFKLVADCILGRAEQAWRTFCKVAPDSAWNPVGNSRAEPFSFQNCYSRCEEWPGISGYPWRTGTANWFTMGILEWILGARRHYDGLLIDPCLSREVPKARLIRTFRGTRYQIEIDNTAGRCRGVQSLSLNGQPIEGNLLPVPDSSDPVAEHHVKVVL